MRNFDFMNATNVQSKEVWIPSGNVQLHGELALPSRCRRVVLFAHGGGKDRRTARYREMARRLQRVGIATLLFGLLKCEEAKTDLYTREHGLDSRFLARRLQDATAWTRSQLKLPRSLVGYVGADTASAATLIAAAQSGADISAVVSVGGRPDLAASEALGAIKAPTLLIVGAADYAVIQITREAYGRLRCSKKLAIIPGATRFFEEPGTLEQVSDVAAGWLTRHMVSTVGKQTAGGT